MGEAWRPAEEERRERKEVSAIDGRPNLSVYRRRVRSTETPRGNAGFFWCRGRAGNLANDAASARNPSVFLRRHRLHAWNSRERAGVATPSAFAGAILLPRTVTLGLPRSSGLGETRQKARAKGSRCFARGGHVGPGI